jgi:hypothetical protein
MTSVRAWHEGDEIGFAEHTERFSQACLSTQFQFKILQ